MPLLDLCWIKSMTATVITHTHTNHLLRVTGSINCLISHCISKEGFTVWGKEEVGVLSQAWSSLSFMKLLNTFQLPHWCTDDTHTHTYTHSTHSLSSSHTHFLNTINPTNASVTPVFDKEKDTDTEHTALLCIVRNTAMQYVTLHCKQTEILFHTAGLCSLCLR